MYVIYSMYKYIETNMFWGGDSPVPDRILEAHL